MSSGRQACLALALLAVAATVSMPTCARAATSAGPLSSYALATVRGIAGHWVATINNLCTEMILTPQGRLTYVSLAWFGGAGSTVYAGVQAPSAGVVSGAAVSARTSHGSV